MSESCLKVSIITVNYNNKSGLKKTLISIEKIKNRFVEFLVIDGNSTDGSAEIIKDTAFIDSYLIEPDDGIYEAMNKGIKLANGQSVIFMNSGDEFAPEFDFFGFFNVTEHLNYEDTLMYGNSINEVGAIRYYKKSPSYQRNQWKTGIPCHQSVFLPLKFIKNNLFNIYFKIYADANLILACSSAVSDVYRYDLPICVFKVGGLSSVGAKSYDDFFIHGKEYCKVYGLTGFQALKLYIKKGLKIILLKLLGYKLYYSLSYALRNAR